MLSSGNEKFYFCDQVEGKISNNDFIDVSESQLGKILVSDSFGSCIAVLAILKEDKYGLYHAYNADESPDFNEFIASIKACVSHVYVFQKLFPPKNVDNAIILAKKLSNHLNCEISNIQLNGYTGIYANFSEKEIVLFKQSFYSNNAQNTQIFFDKTKLINIDKFLVKETNELASKTPISSGSIWYHPENEQNKKQEISKQKNTKI